MSTSEASKTPESADPNKLDALDVYKLYRSRIEQQSSLLTQRVSVVIPLQSALLVAWSWFKNDKTGAFKGIEQMAGLIPLIALAQLGLALAGSAVCYIAIAKLKEHFNGLAKRAERNGVEFVDSEGKAVDIHALFGDPEKWSESVLPPVASVKWVHAIGHIASIIVLVLLFICWLYVFSPSIDLTQGSR